MSPQLKAKLASWVEHGFISQAQAEQIVVYETRVPERPWVLYGIAGIGVTALVTGIVSLIASNWEDISAGVKLSCYFLLQAGLGYGFYRESERPGLARETWLTLFVPTLLAGIGLIAQIYNLHGDGWQALLLWASISLPMVYLAHSWAAIHLWMAALFTASVIWADADSTRLLPDFGRECVVVALPLVVLGLGVWSERIPTFNVYLRKTAVVWGMTVILLVGSLVANALWSSSMPELDGHLIWVLLPWAALIAAASAVWYRYANQRAIQLSLVGLLLSSGLFMTLPLFHTSYETSLGVDLLGAFGFFCTWGLAAAAAAYSQHRRWFDLASLVIAIRVVVVYFEVFGSLAMTGLGLIVSGVVILAIAFAWHRFRGQVRQQLGGGA